MTPISHSDAFTGTWRFNAQLSKLSAESPQSWVQEILVTTDEVHVREIIVRPDGSESVVSLQARFDGRDYPVSGSPAADTIAYTRIDRDRIAGMGKKNHAVALMETATVDPDSRTLTLSYTIHQGNQEVARGIAVFEKVAWAGSGQAECRIKRCV